MCYRKARGKLVDERGREEEGAKEILRENATSKYLYDASMVLAPTRFR